MDRYALRISGMFDWDAARIASAASSKYLIRRCHSSGDMPCIRLGQPSPKE